MLSIASLLVAFLCQQEPAPSLPAGVDRVVLKEGGVLDGTIVKETKDYVQMRLGTGTEVGFDRQRVASIEHGAATAAKTPSDAATLAPRDEWYVVHDGEGRPVGRLHATVAAADDGQLRLAEEWEFVGKERCTAVTLLETVTRDLQPLSCFYHERTLRPGDDRTLSERVVRATVADGHLVVTHRDDNGHKRQVYELDPELRFPLALLEDLRQRHAAATQVTCPVFDPGKETFARQTYRVVPRRRVELLGKPIEVRELCVETSGTAVTEWLDGGNHSVMREVNGPALVAVPSTPELAERYLGATGPVYQPALLTESGQRFALWLPNPMWQFDAKQPAGQITARARLHDASVTLMVLDQLDADVELESAADTVVRWLELGHREFHVVKRDAARLRGQRALRIEALYEEAAVGVTSLRRCLVYVFVAEGRWHALCCAAPKVEFAELLPDFLRILERVQIHAQDIAPKLQGPLSEAESKR